MASDAAPSKGQRVREWFAFIVSAVAVIIAVLSYYQAQKADETARKAAEREHASLIDFLAWKTAGVESLSIGNHTRKPITDVTVSFTDGAYINVDTVPPCVMWYVQPLSTTTQYNEVITLRRPARLDFTDSNDPPQEWTVTEKLEKRSSQPNLEVDVTAHFSGQMYQQATACG
ncbi:hypothetical protein ACFV9D_00430 [Streptomyces sp. NPDC059875]|uniref:hypothetical protein n=1 Tax=unclassified Streptomyces TaxID=2593676 RepID=UPI00365CF1E4